MGFNGLKGGIYKLEAGIYRRQKTVTIFQLEIEVNCLAV